MANFEAIKAAIDAVIKTNGRQEITGEVMNGVLNGMVDAVNEKKQDTLVSGETIKTINGQSILGEGDIIIEGGEGYDDTEIREDLAEVETALGNKVDATYVDNAIASAITNTLNTEV